MLLLAVSGMENRVICLTLFWKEQIEVTATRSMLGRQRKLQKLVHIHPDNRLPLRTVISYLQSYLKPDLIGTLWKQSNSNRIFNRV